MCGRYLESISVAGSELGRSVSLSSDGHTVAMRAPFSFEDLAVDPPGTVRVLSCNGNEWILLGRSLHGKGDDGGFGNSVSLSINGRVVAIRPPSPKGTACVEVHAFDGAIWVPL